MSKQTATAVAAALLYGTFVGLRTRVRLRYPNAERKNRELVEEFRLEPLTELESVAVAGPARAVVSVVPAAVVGGVLAAILDSALAHHRITVASPSHT